MVHVRYCLVVFGNGSENNTQRQQKILSFACALFWAEENSTTYRTCEGNLDGSPSDSCTNLNLSTSFTKSAVPANHRILLPIFPQLRSRSTRQDADLALPRVRTNAGKRRFLHGTMRRYNDLPSDVCSLSVSSFKRHLSSLFLDNT